MKLKIVILSLLTSFLIILGYSSIYAQEETELDLRMRRDFGYGFGANIQGTFSLHASSSEDLVKVLFFIDDELLAEINQPPFHVQFQTGSYDPGVHTLEAIGYTQDAKQVFSRQIRANFLSAEEARSSLVKIFIPIIGLIIAITGISIIAPLLLRRRKPVDLAPGSPRNYGMFGGTICSNCKRPFSIQGWGLNLIVGKFNRCPFCGKFGVVKRANPSDLTAAEAAELNCSDTSAQPSLLSDEERLRKEISDSRYHNL